MAKDPDSPLISGLSRRIWIWVPLCALLTLLLTKLIETTEEANRALFESYSEQFTRSITLIHLLWLQEHKPKKIRWPQPNAGMPTGEITINDNGWPAVTLSISDMQKCQLLWQQVLSQPLTLNNHPIESIPIIKNKQWQGCKYRFFTLSFTYWHTTGLVESL